jgi:zinc/manganese transport system ATP-binding protein
MPQVRQQPLIDSRLSAYAWLGANLDGYRWGIPAFKTEQKNELERVIHLVKAKDIIHKSFSLLSGGERQRLLLAQALLNRPKILLLDEPLMNLDPYYQATLVDLINTIRLKCRVAVLFTSHDINPLLRCVSRVIYLAQGKAAIGLVDEVINSKQLSALYGMDIQVIQYEEQLFVINKELGFHSHADHCTPDTHRHPI